MNYLTEIPRDTLYLIFSYLNFEEIKFLVDNLQVYINHGIILAMKYPVSYNELHPYIYRDAYYFHKLLDLVEYQDDPKKTIIHFTRVESKVNEHEIINILAEIVLKNEYSSLINYFKRLPEFELKYMEIYNAMMELEQYKGSQFYDNFSRLLYENNPDLFQDVNFVNDIREELEDKLYDYGILFIYIFWLKYRNIIKNKFRDYIDRAKYNNFRPIDLGTISDYRRYEFILLDNIFTHDRY